MASQARETFSAVSLPQGFEAELAAEPYRFDFFLALRWLESRHRGKPRIGHATSAKQDIVRLTQEPSLAFAPATLASFKPATPSERSKLAVYFFGLLGPHGPLPLHLTDYALRRRDHHHDPTFIAFLDLFHQRMLALFYRAWASAEPVVSLDRPDNDRFAIQLGALCGRGMDTLRHRDAMPDSVKLHFVGRLACQTRNAEGLTAILEDFFSLPVQIIEFVGQWLRIPGTGQWRLGETWLTGTLGATTMVGEYVWDCQNKFRIVLGPLDLLDYVRFLPDTENLQRLVAIVRNYRGDELSWDVRLILKKQQIPQLKLGGDARLGWTSWLTAKPLTRDGDDLLLNPHASVDPEETTR